MSDYNHNKMKKYYITKLMNVADKCIYIKVTEDIHALVHNLKGLKEIPDFEKICDVRYLVCDNITDCRLIYLFYVHQIAPKYNSPNGFLKPTIELKMPHNWKSYHDEFERVYPYSFRDSVEWAERFHIGSSDWPKWTLQESKFLISECYELYGELPCTLEEARMIYCAVTPTNKVLRELTGHLIDIGVEYNIQELRDALNDYLKVLKMTHVISKKEVGRIYKRVKYIKGTNKIVIERV